MGLFTDSFKELKKASEPLYKTPKSIQETIEIMKVAENGIFEVAKTVFPNVTCSRILIIQQPMKQSRWIFLKGTANF